jgi:4-amino-4-deoxy-L-arabinose transferase-like glycosyltransferase
MAVETSAPAPGDPARGRRWGRVRLGGPEIALVGVLLAGAVLRIWLIRSWRPAFLGYPDSLGYIDAAWRSGHGLLFWNQYRPAGYPLFLTWLHAINGSLGFAIDLQHVLGLAAALLVYLSVARFTRRRWMAVLPAAVIALSGSEIYLEHSALSETLYTFLVIAALWCAARSYDSAGRREAIWLLGSGLLIGLSGPVRSVGVFVGVVLIGWAAATRRGRGHRLRGAAVVAAGFVLSLGGYLVYQHSTTGTWGLTRTTGETLYARTAVFANCRDFTPPAGTARLCQPRGAPRLGPTAYMFAPNSPALRLFGSPPDPRSGGAYRWAPDSKLEAFAIAAITHQPWGYTWSTISTLGKYVVPTFGDPNLLEWNQDTLITALRDPPIQAQAAPLLAQYYPHEPVVEHSMTALDDYAKAVQVEGPVTVILVLLMLAGFILARGRRQAAAGLFGWTTLVMMLAPVALLFYGVRYATPAYGPLAAAAAIGLDELVELASHRSDVIAGVRRRYVDRLPPGAPRGTSPS